MPDETHEAWELDLPAEAPAEEAAPTVPPSAKRIVEAMLFVGGAPLTAKRAGELIRGLTPEQFQAHVSELNADYRRQNRPYAIQPQDDGHILALRPRFRSVVDRLFGGVREARLSSGVMDVLAIVAYRQPLNKGETDAVLGHDAGAALRQLVRRGLVQVAPRSAEDPKDLVYRTSPRFLEFFGIQSLEDLPRTHDLQQM
jgi:segregation and condensation protein B